MRGLNKNQEPRKREPRRRNRRSQSESKAIQVIILLFKYSLKKFFYFPEWVVPIFFVYMIKISHSYVLRFKY